MYAQTTNWQLLVRWLGSRGKPWEDPRGAQAGNGRRGHRAQRMAEACGVPAFGIGSVSWAKLAELGQYLTAQCPVVCAISRRGYTLGTKTAVSLPDEVFASAETLAKRLKLTRSELYSRALAEYLARHSPDEITDPWNSVRW